MTHDELLARIDEDEKFLEQYFGAKFKGQSALRAVVELHKPVLVMGLAYQCDVCRIPPDDEHNYSSPSSYPCETIDAIEKELK